MTHLQQKKDDLWVLIRLHLLYKMTQQYRLKCQIIYSHDNIEALEAVSKKLLEVIEYYKNLPAPPEIIAYQSAIQKGQRPENILGGLTFTEQNGFLLSLFTDKPDELRTYLFEPLGSNNHLLYSAVKGQGVVFYSSKDRILSVNYEGNVVYDTSTAGSSFVIFLNVLFLKARGISEKDLVRAHFEGCLQIYKDAARESAKRTV